MKKHITVLLALLLVALTACSVQNNSTGSTDNSSDSGSTDKSVSAADTKTLFIPSKEEIFTERDLAGTYADDDITATITYTQDGVSAEGTGVKTQQGTCRIVSEGIFIVKGTSDNARIEVSAAKAKVQIVLSEVNLTSKNGSVIYIENAKKVFITLADGTENTLSDTGTYNVSTNEDAVIFSKEDLTINGNGKLTVSGNYAHGIVTKDDLCITGGEVSVTATKSCINGKNSVSIADGTFNLNAGTDAIKSVNKDDTEKGSIYVYDGTFSVHAESDGFYAQNALMISGGTFAVDTSTGADSAEHKSGMDFDTGGFGRKGQDNTENASDDSVSAKAFKAKTALCFFGGTYTIDSLDDALHTNGTLYITGGTFSVKAGDDALHADSKLVIADCTMDVSASYEGIESLDITINGGNISLTASDDGINANGDEHQSEGTFTVNGGYLNVIAGGDGLDSNGYIYVNGGTLLVSGPENNGNGALDYGAEAVVTGGTMIICGSSGMAQNFGSNSTQCSVMCNMNTVSAGTRISCTDADGNIVVSFVPTHSYASVVISSPKLSVGETYTICTGGTCECDENGFADEGKLSDGTSLGEITLTKTVSTFGSSGAGGKGRH